MNAKILFKNAARSIGVNAEELMRKEVAPMIGLCGDKVPKGQYFKYSDFNI
jgi:hypothetical protein